MNKQGFVYLLASDSGTPYVGVTSNLPKRISEHKNKVDPKSFTSRHNIHKLVYFEQSDNIENAIAREKQVKSYRREKKEKLIRSQNPGWRDLFYDIEW